MWKGHSESYQKIYHALDQYHQVTVNEMINKYKIIYGNYRRETVLKTKNDDIIVIYNAYSMAEGNWGNKQELIKRIDELENRLAYYDTNLTLKLFLKLSKIRFPFKRQIRAWLLK